MRRKILKSTANNLCQMFCGWQLVSAYETIARLGSGRLEIDVLSGESRHNGAAIEPVVMAKILRSFLNEDLARHAVPPEAILEGRLVVDLTVDPHEGNVTAVTSGLGPDVYP